jgi:ribonuclease P protein component
MMKLAAIDEKNFPTTQPAAQTDSWISRTDGYPRRTRDNKAPAPQGAKTAGGFDSGQAAGLRRGEPSCGFSAAARLHCRAEFLRTQREGIRSQTMHFVTYAVRSPGSRQSRLGVTVSRRVGGAVVRNRIKRRVRELFRRELRAALPASTDLVVIARSGAGNIDYNSLRAELLTAARAVGRKL